MRSRSVVVSAFLLPPVTSRAQDSVLIRVTDSTSQAIDAAVATSDVREMAAALALAERAASARPGDRLLQHYHGYALYRMAAMTYGRDGSGAARPYVERARDVLQRLASDSSATTIPETYALLSAVYGLQISTSRSQMVAGMRFGPKATEWMDRAVAAGASNPRVWLLNGIGALNTPAAFGGGLARAETYLKQALAMFQTDEPAPGHPSWGKAEVHAWLGQVYQKQHRIEPARREYATALALQPGNTWVKSVLLPGLDRAR